MLMTINENAFPARLKLLMASLLLVAGGYSAKSAAAITASSCSWMSTVADGYKLKPAPAQMTDGFVLASQNLSVTYKYTKTGTGGDVLNFGAWYPQTGLGAFSTKSVYNAAGQLIPGLGFRLSNVTSGLPAGTTPFETLSYRTVYAAGISVASEAYVMEFLVTNASLYKGGTPSQLGPNTYLNMVMGNAATWNDKNLQPGGQRCTGLMMVDANQVLQLGGVTPPVLPPPTLPTCDLGGTDISVTLDPIDASQLTTSGASAGTTSFTIPLGYCGKDAKPYITLTDSADITNRSSNLTLAPSSTAKGVRIKLTKGDGSPLQLGAQNKTVSSNNVGQFLVGTSPADNTPMSVKLNAAYVRTNDKIEAGSVKADAIFTIAYP